MQLHLLLCQLLGTCASGGRKASQENRRVGARSSPRPDGVWGEKNAPVVPTMGMCGPAALDPTVPVRRDARGGPASTEVERELKSTAEVCPCGRRLSGGWSSLACPRGGISGAPRGGVQLGLTPCVGRCMRNSHAGSSGHVGRGLLSTLVPVDTKKQKQKTFPTSEEGLCSLCEQGGRPIV